MSDVTTQTQRDAVFDGARRDLLVASAIAATLMIGTALFASQDLLWGVALGALLAIANLSALARLTAEMLTAESGGGWSALKAAFKVLALMFVVVAVLWTRPQHALGLCLGLALPALAGIVVVLRGRERRLRIVDRLRRGIHRRGTGD
ncbi:MAG: hypothetical protein ABIJ09_19255 [Pseudomonadota bacterium]